MQTGTSDPVAGDAARLCERLRVVDRADRLRVTETWLREASSQYQNSAALRLMLLDAGRAIATTLCCDRSAPCQCGRVAWPAVGGITTSTRDPQAAFLALAGDLFAQIDRDHPEPPVDRAAAMVRANPQRAWRLSLLAARVGEPPHRLRPAFARRFGIGVREYVHLARIARALEVVERSWKVAAIACDLGYRSKKDCYAAMDRWLGVTPGRLRAWSAEERRALALRLETILRQGAGEGGPHESESQRRRRLRLARSSAE